MSKKKNKIVANVEQPEGVRTLGGRPRSVVTEGVKISSATNVKNPDMTRGVKVVGGK